MSTCVMDGPARTAVSDREIIRRVNALRKTDNLTNWFYIAREYLFLGSVIALTIAFYNYHAELGLGWQWDVPVTLLAVVLLGAGQHRLTTLSRQRPAQRLTGSAEGDGINGCAIAGPQAGTQVPLPHLLGVAERVGG